MKPGTKKELLRGRTALVTGASSGIGADFARQLAAQGCHLILVARRADRLQALQNEIVAQHGVSVDCVPLDLSQPSAPHQLLELLASTDRSIDVLINNAGQGLFGYFSAVTWSSLQQLLQVDLVALTELTHLCLAGMLKRGRGHILLVASNGAFQPTPTYAAYAAAKSYVLSLGAALHYELRHSPVQCTVLCPGVTRTEFFQVAGQKPTTYQRLAMMESANVARIGLRAMLAGRACIVAGRLNTLVAWLTRLVPRQWLAAMAERAMR